MGCNSSKTFDDRGALSSGPQGFSDAQRSPREKNVDSKIGSPETVARNALANEASNVLDAGPANLTGNLAVVEGSANTKGHWCDVYEGHLTENSANAKVGHSQRMNILSDM